MGIRAAGSCPPIVSAPWSGRTVRAAAEVRATTHAGMGRHQAACGGPDLPDPHAVPITCVAPMATMHTSLDACVQKILKDEEFPAFSDRLQLLMHVEREDQSAQKLADLVLQDFGLTLKVLQVANSFQYNRSSKTIDSVSRAIMVMGVRTVQGLASSLAFFEHYQKRSPVLKRLMLLSMLTAHHASAAAEGIGFKEREEAHLAGMFRNLGEVLVSCHCPAQYARISIETHGGAKAPNTACIRALG
ncbi:MAG: HDOD domain-containing protein, partial [Vicinamibacterales bacterium]